MLWELLHVVLLVHCNDCSVVCCLIVYCSCMRIPLYGIVSVRSAHSVNCIGWFCGLMTKL